MIHRTAIIVGTVDIGDGTRIGPFAVIGTDAEHKGLPSVGRVIIGARCTIRENVVMQRGTGDRETTIGDDCYLMDRVHVGHDCVLAEDVTVSPHVVLGGHTRIHAGATIGMGALIHQHTTIGAYAMIGAGAVVVADVPPFCVVVGNPARFLRMNVAGFERALGLQPGEDFAKLIRADVPILREARIAFDSDRRAGRRVVERVKP